MPSIIRMHIDAKTIQINILVFFISLIIQQDTAIAKIKYLMKIILSVNEKNLL